MADTMSREQRSRLMSRIKSRGNSTTEVAMVGIMRRSGIVGWRRHLRILSFRPDFVFRRERVVVFVDGCFWHSCPEHGSVPSSNVDFWRGKLEANLARDRRADTSLADSGWKVVRLWEHDVRRRPLACAGVILEALARKDSASCC